MRRGGDSEWWLIYAVGGAVLCITALVTSAYFLAAGTAGLTVACAGMAWRKRHDREP